VRGLVQARIMFDVTKKGCVTGIYPSSGTTVSFNNRATRYALDLDLEQTTNKASLKK
jgi:predicted ester cyclase